MAAAAASSVFRSMRNDVTLILSMFIYGSLCFGIPPEFSVHVVGKSVPYQDATLRLVQDGRNPCTSSSESGVCYKPLNCLTIAGTFGNNCPGSDGVCCLFYRKCGQQSSQEVSYFQSADEVAGSGCNYRVVKRSAGYCGMRLKLEQLELPVDCGTSIQIEGIQKGKSIGRLQFPERNSIDVICSTEAGKEYAFDASTIDEIQLNVESTNSNSGRWKIKITQVHCRDEVEVDPANEHSSGYIPAVWPPPLPTHPPSHTHPTHPTPSRPTTAQPPASSTCWWNCQPATQVTTTRRPASPPIIPSDPSMDYSRCGVKGPDTRSQVYRKENDMILNGEPLPFIQDNTFGNPSRNESTHAAIVRNLMEIKIKDDPFYENLTGRITFGKPSGPQEYPWQVGMKVRGRFHCGASIIGDQYILTAAHCVTKYKNRPTTLQLTLGDYDLSTPNEQPSYVPTVERITVHPAYSRTTLRNDLAVLKLKKKIRYASNIRPICLAPAGMKTTGEIAIVTGWGRDENNRLQSKLVELASQVDENSYCAAQWEKNGAPRGFITKDMMCMSPIGGDSCNGDSGGPSVIKVGSTHYQVGIVSFGSGSCVDESLPGVYTRVTSYRDWILQQMN